MDFRLRAFLAVAHHLSFTKAAKELGISQPAVSKHVQELENTYRVHLFSRQGGQIGLTPEGVALKRHAERIVAEFDRMNLEMELLRNPVFGPLRVGLCTDVAQRLYKEVLPLFERSFHNVQLIVQVSSGKNLEEALHNGELDLVLLGNSGTVCGFDVVLEKGLSPQAEVFLKYVKSCL